MGLKTTSSPKVKVTASLDPELVKTIDAYIAASKTRSRSQLIEDILRQWSREQKRQALEGQIEQYYLSLSDGERQEDEKWTEIAAESAHHHWEE
jgi:metal-responsive CopG/Arc/MetJ family transcriptional regulator